QSRPDPSIHPLPHLKLILGPRLGLHTSRHFLPNPRVHRLLVHSPPPPVPIPLIQPQREKRITLERAPHPRQQNPSRLSVYPQRSLVNLRPANDKHPPQRLALGIS